MKGLEQTEVEIVEKLVGAWTLVTWYETTASGEIHYPLGEDALGQIVYTADRHMSAQLVAQSQPRFQSEDWRQATQAETALAWKNYFGYFGTFHLDLGRQAVIHRIEGAWFPNLQGSEQIRRFVFDRDRLILDADTQWGQVHIVWQRVHASAANGA